MILTVDSGMIRTICGVSLKDPIPMTDLLLCLGLSSINEMLRWNRLRFYGHLLRMNDNIWMIMYGLKGLPYLTLMAGHQEVNHVRDLM